MQTTGGIQMLEPFVSFAISLSLTLVLMPYYIRFLNRINHSQSISEYSLDEFKSKKKTPTMGGVLFVLIPLLAMLIVYPLSYTKLATGIVYLAFLGYSLIGFWDDALIVIQHKNDGLKPLTKFISQVVLAILFYFLYRQSASSTILIPFTQMFINLGWLYAILVFVMFAGASNGVNLTDGMDGLAGGTSLLAFIPFAYFAYTQNNIELLAFIVAVMGSLIGYLRYNWHPAKIIMGDTGALALGGVLAALAMVLKQEFALIVIGGVFVFETICVILQIGSVKLRKKKIFRYTPIHYSFTLSGWKETNVVLFFWLLGAICAVLGLLIGVMQ